MACSKFQYTTPLISWGPLKIQRQCNKLCRTQKCCKTFNIFLSLHQTPSKSSAYFWSQHFPFLSQVHWQTEKFQGNFNVVKLRRRQLILFSSAKLSYGMSAITSHNGRLTRLLIISRSYYLVQLCEAISVVEIVGFPNPLKGLFINNY